MFKQFKFKLFIKLYCSYLVMILLPFVVISVMLTHYVMNAYKSDVFSLFNNVTEYISSIMDNNLYNIERAANNLRVSNNVLRLSAATSFDDNESIYNLTLLKDELVLHESYQNSISSIQLFYGGTQTAITRSNRFPLVDYYNRIFRNSSLSLKDLEAVLNGGRSTILLSDHEYYDAMIDKKLVSVVRPLFRNSNRQWVTLVASIETGSVFETFDSMTDNLSEAYFVIANDSEPLLKNDDTPDVLDWQSFLSSDVSGSVNCKNNHIAYKEKSILSGINYVYIFSEAEILARVNRIQNMLSIVILFLTLLLLGLAYFVSCRSFSPVAAIIANSGANDTYYKLDDYSDITTLVTDTINTNHALRSTVDRQRKCISDNLFIMLLQNSMDMNKQALDLLFADTQPKLDKPFYNVIILNVLNYSSLSVDVARLSTVENLRRTFEEAGISVALIPDDAGRIILLANHGGTPETLYSALKRFETNIKFNPGLELSICVGRAVENLSLFSKSYEDAIYSSTFNKSGITLPDDSPQTVKNVFFNADDKNYLKNKLLSGDGAAVLSFFDNLMNIIFVENTLTYRQLSYIRYSLGETLFEVIYKTPSDTVTAKIAEDCRPALDGHDYMNSFKTVSDCYLRLCDRITELQSTPSEELRETLLSYIEKNYTNPDISLNQIAAELHFSYSYLCKFFKKEMGCVFVDYLHKIRIEKAREILANTDKSIAETAVSLGYLSSNTFIKTFKKYEGISPGEYRKNLKK